MSTENGKMSTKMSSFKSNSAVPTIKKEPAFMINGDSLRLSSFSSPRDLTLGGRGLNKKIFTPNLNVVRNKNSNVKTSKDTSSRGRRSDRGKPERGGRGRGRGGTFIQTAGVFSEGAGAVNVRRSLGSSSCGRSEGDSSSNMRKPMLVKRETAKTDVQADAAHVRELLGDSDDDFSCDEKTDLNHIPVKLSIDKWKTFKVEKIKPMLELKKELDDKSELNLENGEVQQKMHPANTFSDSNSSLRYPLSVDEFFHFPQSQLFLIQLPDTLPCEEDDNLNTMDTSRYSNSSSPAQYASTSKDNTSKIMGTVSPESGVMSSSSCLKSAQKSNKSNTIKQMEEGQVGKLLRYKSGKCKLILGESHFDLNIGMETGFIQDLMSINTNREERNGNMINLGRIAAKITATPDWEYLLKHQ